MDLLKSVQVIRNKESSQDAYQICSLLDLIVLDGDTIFTKGDPMKIVYFKDAEWKNDNEIFSYFKRVGKINIDIYSSDLSTKLKLLQKALIDEVEQIYFSRGFINVFRKVINSKCINYKVQNLSNIFISGDWLRDVELKNISKIKPKKLHQIVLR